MKDIIKLAIEKGISYEAYRNLMQKLLSEGKVSGVTQSEELHHYGTLNEARMHRLDKTMVITTDVLEKINHLNKPYTWLVIAETWCGDAAQILPVINKMALASNNIDLKIVLRDENDALMNLFLTNGTKSIPKLIIIDSETLDVLGDFGPRPNGAKQLILDYKATHGVVDETAKVELQKWYLQDKGVSIQNEIMTVFEKELV
ncbi:thioredoxin family protein [Flavobacterium croceum]|uniref:Thioredoxin-like protein n=1 Tax=Flavobacterium croceum DSM 17960 TaxID=1121886 RepID=A0A2S4N6G3_9FLAO|nr:thioredoxin family protein [Flavobacterium croceum]POS01270.1 thioredoxin-like protein [Flavobacterium croceum DSM 17960]